VVFVNVPEFSRHTDLSTQTHFWGLLQKRKPHESDWRLYTLLFWHPSSHFITNRQEKFSKKKKTVVLKILLKIMSTMIPSLSWVWVPRILVLKLNSRKVSVVNSKRYDKLLTLVCVMKVLMCSRCFSVFIITDKAKTRRGGGRRCLCYERRRTTTWGDGSLSHTRLSGEMLRCCHDRPDHLS
jgi:hypothetical protein